jgi:CRISPR-associated protein Cas1
MSRNYYVFSSGRLRREENTLYMETAEGRRPVPIEDVDSLYIFGELDLNTKLLNFLSQQKVPLHIFNYYGYYAGSYYPREYLNSGYLLVRQVEHYLDSSKRLPLAREFVCGAAHSIVRALAYYQRRKASVTGEDTQEEPFEGREDGEEEEPEGFSELEEEWSRMARETEQALPGSLAAVDAEVVEGGEGIGGVFRQTLQNIGALMAKIEQAQSADELRGLEGKIRECYYGVWRYILREGPGIVFEKRVRRPPDNMVNALISFGNSMLYSACLTQIYRTQLNPTISYLHEPGARRFSLALDLSEVFKPLIVDRAIFTLLNTRQLRESHFDQQLNYCHLGEAGRKIFVKAFEEKLQTTLYHRQLKRHVSYQHLIRLECYRLMRHLTDVEPYRAFRAWW